MYSMVHSLSAPCFFVLVFFFFFAAAATDTSDWGLKIDLRVLNWGHTCNPQYITSEWRTEMITGELVGMIEVTRSTRARDSDWTYQGGPRGSDQQPPDTILYGGSYLQWWNGGKERVQSTLYWIEKNEKLQTRQNPVKEEHTDTEKYSNV